MKTVLAPLRDNPVQTYCDSSTQLADVVDFIVNDIGGADFLAVTTYSTSEEFLRRMNIMKTRGMIRYCILLADLKAVHKTLQLRALIKSTFDEAYLSENHSKVILVSNGDMNISVCTSQNQTRGNRLEAGIITTDSAVFGRLYSSIFRKINLSVKI